MNLKTFLLKVTEKAGLAALAAVLAVGKETDWSAAGKYGAPIGIGLGVLYGLLTRLKGDPNSASVVTPTPKD